MIRLTFDVTQDEIRLGVPGNKAFCPIALALWWRIPGHKEIHEDGTITVHPLHFEVRPMPGKRWGYRIQVPSLGKEICRFKLPEDAIAWMKAFDSGAKVAPATFTVEFEDPRGKEYDDGDQEDPHVPGGL